jgi:hypothetical protein
VIDLPTPEVPLAHRVQREVTLLATHPECCVGLDELHVDVVRGSKFEAPVREPLNAGDVELVGAVANDEVCGLKMPSDRLDLVIVVGVEPVVERVVDADCGRAALSRPEFVPTCIFVIGAKVLGPLPRFKVEEDDSLHAAHPFYFSGRRPCP